MWWSGRDGQGRKLKQIQNEIFVSSFSTDLLQLEPSPLKPQKRYHDLRLPGRRGQSCLYDPSSAPLAYLGHTNRPSQRPLDPSLPLANDSNPNRQKTLHIRVYGITLSPIPSLLESHYRSYLIDRYMALRRYWGTCRRIHLLV